jgi:protein-disulfide isomerase
MPKAKASAKKKTRKVATPAAAKVTQPMMSLPTNVSAYSFGSFVSFLNNNFSLILLVGIFFVLGFIVGSLWTEKQLNKSQALNAAGQVAQQPTAPSGPTEADLKKMPAVTKEDHIRGNMNAQIVLVEYSDYECPFCNQFHPTIKKIKEDYGDKVAWVYRHYPLPFHPHAQKASEASECVAKLGGDEAFWKFSDAAFAGVASKGAEVVLSDAGLKQLATDAGVNGDQVMSCVSSGEMTKKVTDQQTAGATAGINGTPGTIIVAGDSYALIPGALPYEQVKAQIDGLIK